MKLLLLIFLIAVPTFSAEKFEFGLENNFIFSELFPYPYTPKTDFQYRSHIYAGIRASYLMDLTQISFSILPGVKVSYKDKENTASFYFRDAYLRFDTIHSSVVLGKRPLAWGVGQVRQYSFLTNTVYAEETARYYNTEILIRKNCIMVSLGVAIDTTAIDLMMAPTWYNPWLYIRIDQPKYNFLFSANMHWEENIGYDFKTAVEFQYFLPYGFEIYSTFSYYFIRDNHLGTETDIMFLAGISYELYHNKNFMFRPLFEYARENNYHIISAGYLMGIYQSIFDISMYINYEFGPDFKRPYLLTRIKWIPWHSLALSINIRNMFWDTGNPIKNLIELKLTWSL